MEFDSIIYKKAGLFHAGKSIMAFEVMVGNIHEMPRSFTTIELSKNFVKIKD